MMKNLMKNVLLLILFTFAVGSCQTNLVKPVNLESQSESITTFNGFIHTPMEVRTPCNNQWFYYDISITDAVAPYGPAPLYQSFEIGERMALGWVFNKIYFPDNTSPELTQGDVEWDVKLRITYADGYNEDVFKYDSSSPYTDVISITGGVGETTEYWFNFAEFGTFPFTQEDVARGTSNYIIPNNAAYQGTYATIGISVNGCNNMYTETFYINPYEPPFDPCTPCTRACPVYPFCDI